MFIYVNFNNRTTQGIALVKISGEILPNKTVGQYKEDRQMS
jgi:hypothetical protein